MRYTKYISVKLTVCEASKLLQAVGNTSQFPEIMESVFIGNKRDIQSCYRGIEKIEKAISSSKKSSDK